MIMIKKLVSYRLFYMFFSGSVFIGHRFIKNINFSVVSALKMSGKLVYYRIGYYVISYSVR